MQKNTIAAIIFSVASFLFFVLVLPQYDVVNVNRDTIVVRQAVLDQKTAALDNVKKLDTQVRSQQADITKIKSFMPERKQTDEVVSSIQKISEQSGMQLSSLTVSEDSATASQTDYKKLFISADIIGNYSAFVNFIKLLEQNLRLYDIFQITGAISTASPGNVNFTIKMNAYYLK